MQPCTLTWLGRVIAMLVMTVSLIDRAAAGVMPIEIRAFHQTEL